MWIWKSSNMAGSLKRPTPCCISIIICFRNPFFFSFKNASFLSFDKIDKLYIMLRRFFNYCRIVNTYLSRGDGTSSMFSETLKMSLFTAISTRNDVSLLCMAHDIVQKVFLQNICWIHAALLYFTTTFLHLIVVSIFTGVTALNIAAYYDNVATFYCW